ncbi:MAG TPA: cytochrome c [Pyrinomonadaceae bacterium]
MSSKQSDARPVTNAHAEIHNALRTNSRRLACLLLTALCSLLLAGCRMDMQDQPKYKVYRSSTFFKDGLSSRPYPEGTVARGYLRADSEFFTGKADKAQAAQSASSGQNTPGQQNQDQRNVGSQAGQTTGASQSGTTQSASSGGNSGGNQTGGGAGGSRQAGGSGANPFAGDLETFPIPVTAELLKRGEERYQIFCTACHGLTGYGDGMVVRRGFRKPPAFYEDRLRQAPVGHFYDVITNGWGAMPNYASQIPVQDRWAIVAYVRALQMTVPAGQPNTSSAQRPNNPVTQSGGKK